MEHKFNDCRDILPLPFDFYIPSRNIIIEVDGEQHFNQKCFGQNKKQYKILKKHDKIKTDYCERNNLELIRIPYNEFNKNDDYKKILNKRIAKINEFSEQNVQKS